MALDTSHEIGDIGEVFPPKPKSKAKPSKKVRPHLTVEDVIKEGSKKGKNKDTEILQNGPEGEAPPAEAPPSDHFPPGLDPVLSEEEQEKKKKEDAEKKKVEDYRKLQAESERKFGSPEQAAEAERKLKEEQEAQAKVDAERAKTDEQKAEEERIKQAEVLRMSQENEAKNLLSKEQKKISTYTHKLTPEQIEKKKSRTLDIVVACYRENTDLIRDRINEIKGMELLQGFKRIRVFVYVKNEELKTEELDKFAADVGAEHIKVLPNKGREGGTYLHHVVSQWDDLADQTFFVQADAHKWEHAKNRILDFYVPETGMLSIGYTLQVCSCYKCQDYWDDGRVFSHIPELWSAVNGQLCPGDTGILMGYQGQMIVSRNNIHKTQRAIYQHLEDILEAEMEHWVHKEQRQSDMFEDSVQNPYFGHTLERSWQTLFHCSETRLYKTCEEVEWRRQEGDPVENCQCLDPEL